MSSVLESNDEDAPFVSRPLTASSKFKESETPTQWLKFNVERSQPVSPRVKEDNKYPTSTFWFLPCSCPLYFKGTCVGQICNGKIVPSKCSFSSIAKEDVFWCWFYLLSWFFLNIIITLYSKIIFSVFMFPYPMTMTAVHLIFTFLGVMCCQWIGAFTPTSLRNDLWIPIIGFSAVFTINILLSNASLLAVSVNLHQVIRTIVPLFTMIISFLVWKEKYPCFLLPSVLTVVIGVALTVWGDMSFEAFDLFVVLIGCFFASLKGILTQKTQIGSIGLSSLDLLRYLCPLAVIQLLTLAIWLGEIHALKDDKNLSPILGLHLVLVGWVAFFLNFVSFRSAALLNPLTLNIAGNVKQVLTCLISLVLFGGTPSWPLIIGIIATSIGAFWYSHDLAKWRLFLRSQNSVPPLSSLKEELEQDETINSQELSSIIIVGSNRNDRN